MSWLEWLKNFWTYSKSERRGVLLLIGVILVVYSTPYVLSFFEEKAEPNSRAFQEEISRFQEELAKKRKQAPENKSKRRDLNPLPFNPNELSRKQAEKLGLPDYVIDNILKYRQEGGHFEEPSDFAELYGLADSTFQKLKPYIRLPDQQASKKKQQNHQKEPFQPDTLFAFNPNDLPIQKWRQLGLPDHIILNIKSYEEQGGYFKTKEDVADIYGMKQKVFAELAPYIQLDNKKKKDQDKRHKKKRSRTKKTAKVDVNNADSLDLLNVKGIGPFYARMILQERRKLGGFVNKEQIKQIYGMQKKYRDDSLTIYQNIQDRLFVGPAQPKQIDINAATVDRLADHPYIDYNLAENIVNYRKQHGPYDSLADVNQLYLVNDDLSRKLEPYLQLP